MNSFFAMRALLFAGECLAASAVLIGAAAFASQFLRQASLRHLAWLTAFGALLVFPAVALIAPPRFAIAAPSSPAESAAPRYVEPDLGAAPPTLAAATPVPAAPVTPVRAGLSAPGPVAIAAMLFAIWLAGVCLALLRLGGAALVLKRLRRESRPHVFDPEAMPRLDVARRECELRLSLGGAGPLTFGFLRPVILLPKSSIGWPRERLKAVLLHELAHVRRRDTASQALALVVAALYWPNPLIHLAARALRREAEMAADDAVLGAGMKPSAYAGELLGLASEFRGRTAIAGVAMAHHSALEARVKSVLSLKPLRTGATPMDALKIACLGLAVTALLALARPDIVAAQDQPDRDAPVVAASDEVPPAPAAPPAPEALPAPPAPPAAEALPAPEAVDDEAPASESHGHAAHALKAHGAAMRHVMVEMRRHQAEMEAASEGAREASEALRKAEPEIEKAIAAAKIDERVAEALAKVEPQVDVKVRAALRKAEPAIRKAIREAHISERVAKALREAQPKIDAAMARVQNQVRAEDNGDVVIRSVTRDSESAGGSDEDNDRDSDRDDDDDSPDGM
jgi:beta-lactamase regulating signal transducer with metallopeptidase domain